METRGDLLLAFGAALAKPSRELIKTWRHDENIRKRALDEGIVARTDARRSKRVHIEQNIDSGGEVLQHSGLQRSVKTAVNLRVLEKIPRCDMFLKFLLTKKKIIFAMHLSGPWRAGGAGHGVNKILLVAERADERGLAGSRRGGDDEEDAFAMDGEAIQCWRVVLECGRVPISLR